MVAESSILNIRDFETLVLFLADELDWPIELGDFEDLDELAFDYSPEELGLSEEFAVKVREIKQLRPLTQTQPWGVFYIDFEPQRLPVTALRRILNRFVTRKRAQSATQKTWTMEDLIFMTAQGEDAKRGMTFAHFHGTGLGKEVLKEFSWDQAEKHFYYIANDYFEHLRWPSDTSDVDGWKSGWRQAFRGSTRQAIKTSKELAEIMALEARKIRTRVVEVYEVEPQDGPVHQLFEAFKKVLIHDMVMDSDKPSEIKFSDHFAQTITYGVFSARCLNLGRRFKVEDVVDSLPATNPFLKGLFLRCFSITDDRGREIDPEELGVTELVEILDNLLDDEGNDQMERILQEFGRQTRGEDPITHFYEGFLDAYEKEQRKRRGVYYTPAPVVSYIVRSVDQILKRDFGLLKGLADASKIEVTNNKNNEDANAHKVQILDPAVGTGTFLNAIVEFIWESFVDQNVDWDHYVSNNLLPRLHGFELLMAPYAVTHLKIGQKLAETGYKFKTDERLRVYMTNTLEELDDTEALPLAEWIATEATEASQIKRNNPVMVVLGNPPYSNYGQMNTGEWILRLLDDYKTGLDEKKLNLNEDSIKFIRFGQWRIEKTGMGILAFITNNTYIDGITHRRMRHSLMETFDDIYVLDLHGNSNKKETTPDGLKDENVFDIQQGVAIGLFVKKPGRNGPTKVYHDALWGLREDKYSALLANDVCTNVWTELSGVDRKTCLGRFFFLAPKSFKNVDEYCCGWSVSDVFPINQNGLKTDRDELFFDEERDNLEERMRTFYSDRGVDHSFTQKYRIEKSSSYDILSRRTATRFDPGNIRKCLYRPFDLKWLYYERGITSRPAWKVMQHIVDSDKNKVLLGMRQYEYNVPNYCYSFVTNCLTECRVFVSNRGIANVFPLYLGSEEDKRYSRYDALRDARVWVQKLARVSSGQVNVGVEQARIEELLEQLFPASLSRWVNLHPVFIKEVSSQTHLSFICEGMGNLTTSFGPEDAFHYIYGILHSPSYRERYAEFLKIDFPRIPLTSNVELFRSLCFLGSQLVALHVMDENGSPISGFPVAGDNLVEKISFRNDSHVFINRNQYFDRVPAEVWEFYVGGYQVCHKWLKDRKGRQLTNDDIEHYQKIVAALAETIRIMAEIDAVIEKHGGFPIV